MTSLDRLRAKLLAQKKSNQSNQKVQDNETSTRHQIETSTSNDANTGSNNGSTSNSNNDTGLDSTTGQVYPSNKDIPVQRELTQVTVTQQKQQISEALAAPLSKSEVSYDDLNLEQKAAVRLAAQSSSFCLIGPAGSGKTTNVKAIAREVIDVGIARRFTAAEATDKFVGAGMLSIAILSFTNQAVRNIRESMPEQLKANCSTIHNITEFQPVEYSDTNDLDEFGQPKEKMVFAPKYGSLWNQAGNQLLPHFDLVVVEEAGSVSLELFELFYSALPRAESTQFIFLGDLNQLPPVFDDAILGFKQLELPLIELTEVYRNVGLVTKLAHRILTGKPINDNEAKKLSTSDDSGKIQFVKFQKRYQSEMATIMMGKYLQKMIADDKFSIEDSVVLIPFNEKFGTKEINKYIQQAITDKYELEVYEVIARYITSYHCVGDRVLHNRNYHKIIRIDKNPSYEGKEVTPPSKYLTRFGRAKKGKEKEVFGNILGVDEKKSAEELLEEMDFKVGKDTTESSHTIYLENLETGAEVKVAGGKINSMLPTYAMTVHKAQGSEWKNVYLVLHHSHAVMASRELIYTAITRARENLTVFYSGNYTNKAVHAKSSMLYKCLVKQKIAGHTAKDKLNFFKKRARSYIQKNVEGKTRDKFIELYEDGKLT